MEEVTTANEVDLIKVTIIIEITKANPTAIMTEVAILLFFESEKKTSPGVFENLLNDNWIESLRNRQLNAFFIENRVFDNLKTIDVEREIGFVYRWSKVIV